METDSFSNQHFSEETFVFSRRKIIQLWKDVWVNSLRSTVPLRTIVFTLETRSHELSAERSSSLPKTSVRLHIL